MREGDDDDPFAFELLRCLAEPTGVEDELADLVLGGEFADLVDAVEDAFVAVVDLAADVVLLVDPDDGARALVAGDVDADPDRFAGREAGLADALLPAARW